MTKHGMTTQQGMTTHGQGMTTHGMTTHGQGAAMRPEECGAAKRGGRRRQRTVRRIGPRTYGSVLVAISVLVAGCFGGEKISDPNGGGQEPVDHKARVVVTNAGDGAGEVTVTFPAGTVTNGCDDVLEAGDTCTVDAEHTAAIGSVSILAGPGDFSAFVRYGGDCSGTALSCTLGIAETTVAFAVEVVFDLRVARIDFNPDPMALAVGAEGSVTAAAFADPAGAVGVPEATFTWTSSNASVATVQGGTGGSATVTGVAAGQAWIRAAARNGRDSVRVVVGG
jgi:hypothetical protein